MGSEANQTHVLTVEPLKMEYAEGLRCLRNKNDVRKWFIDESVVSREQQTGWMHAFERDPNDFMWVAVDATGVVVAAVAIYDYDARRRVAEFGRLMVDPDRTDLRGTGRRLAVFALEFAQSVGITLLSLTVKSSNARAIALYESIDFRTSGELGNQKQTTMHWIPNRGISE